MKILITGGGGFLGQYIVKELIAEGHEVINFSRSNYPELIEMGVTCLQGDIHSEEDLKKAMSGCDAVFHVASKIGMWGRWEDFYRTNVLGTKNVLKVAIANNVKKFVYTSTPSVVSRDFDLCGKDEKLEYPEEFFSMYAHSKALAEKYVLSQNGKNGIMTTALRPHLIYGPGDNNLIPRLVEAHKSGRLKKIGDGHNMVDVVFVENAAKAHVQAFNALKTADKAPAGQAYFLGDEKPVNLWFFVNQIMSIYDLPPVKKQVSRDMAIKVGSVMEKTYRFLRRFHSDPPMTRFVAMQLSQSHYFSHKKAELDFGYNPAVTTKEGLERLGQSISH